MRKAILVETIKQLKEINDIKFNWKLKQFNIDFIWNRLPIIIYDEVDWSYDVYKWPDPKKDIVKYKDWMKTKTNVKESKPVITYETIIRRSDWIEFYKDTIDWETVEQIKKRISTYRTEANKLQWLLKFHSNHF